MRLSSKSLRDLANSIDALEIQTTGLNNLFDKYRIQKGIIEHRYESACIKDENSRETICLRTALALYNQIYNDLYSICYIYKD